MHWEQTFDESRRHRKYGGKLCLTYFRLQKSTEASKVEPNTIPRATPIATAMRMPERRAGGWLGLFVGVLRPSNI